MAKDVYKDRRLGLGLGPVSVFTVTSFILVYTNKLTVSYGGQESSLLTSANSAHKLHANRCS